MIIDKKFDTNPRPTNPLPTQLEQWAVKEGLGGRLRDWGDECSLNAQD